MRAAGIWGGGVSERASYARVLPQLPALAGPLPRCCRVAARLAHLEHLAHSREGGDESNIHEALCVGAHMLQHELVARQVGVGEVKLNLLHRALKHGGRQATNARRLLGCRRLRRRRSRRHLGRHLGHCSLSRRHLQLKQPHPGAEALESEILRCTAVPPVEQLEQQRIRTFSSQCRARQLLHTYHSVAMVLSSHVALLNSKRLARLAHTPAQLWLKRLDGHAPAGAGVRLTTPRGAAAPVGALSDGRQRRILLSFFLTPLCSRRGCSSR